MRVYVPFLFAFFIVISWSSGPTAEERKAEPNRPADYLHSLNQPRFHTLQLSENGRTYGLHVRLPDEYAESRRYPTVYLLDGGITFPMLAAYYRYLSLAEDLPPIILVGISYPGNTFETGNYRSTDFTAPSDERTYYGGAFPFLDSFEDEIFPFIEANYRSDPNRRIIFGQSLGGQFSVFAAQTRPELFWGHIASNPALHRNLEFFTTEYTALTDKQTRPKIFVSLAENDDPRFKKPAQEWVSYWRVQSKIPFEMEIRSQPDHNHFSAAPAAFRQGLMWLLK